MSVSKMERLALLDGGDALEAAAGIDVLRREVAEGAVLVAEVLHEDEVPVLEEALAVVGGVGALEAALGEVVVEDLGVGAAGPDRAAVPVVFGFVVAVDALVGDAGIAPGRVGLVIVVVDADVDALGGELVDARAEVPGPGDGLGLEVVAEAEVAEHLEGGAVAEVAHLLDVGHAEGALNSGGATHGRFGLAGEVRLELLHPRGREEGGRVAHGDEGPGGELAVIALREEVHERSANLVGSPWGRRHCCLRMLRAQPAGCRAGEGVDSLTSPYGALACATHTATRL